MVLDSLVWELSPRVEEMRAASHRLGNTRASLSCSNSKCKDRRACPWGKTEVTASGNSNSKVRCILPVCCHVDHEQRYILTQMTCSFHQVPGHRKLKGNAILTQKQKSLLNPLPVNTLLIAILNPPTYPIYPDCPNTVCCYCCPHFVDEEAEAQKNYVIYPNLHS